MPLFDKYEPMFKRDVANSSEEDKLPNDITISRHRGSSASIDANPSREQKANLRGEVYQYIATHEPTYSKAISRGLGVPLHSISGRISELKKLGRIEELSGREEKCSLLQVKRGANE